MPSALPYFFGGLRIASGLALIGAVVAEFVAGTGGQGAGLAYQILLSGIQLNIPRLFAALVLITVTGVALFVAMAMLSAGARRLARKRDELSAAVRADVGAEERRDAGAEHGLLIRHAGHVLTGMAGAAARSDATDIRIAGGVITEMGRGARAARGRARARRDRCVVYPGWVNTHHHLFQSLLKGVPAGIDAHADALAEGGALRAPRRLRRGDAARWPPASASSS